MMPKDNPVFKVAIHFCRSFKMIIPEAVIYGYAKLISMDEKQVRTLLSNESMEDFEDALEWFEKNHLSLNLIKSGLLLLTKHIQKEEVDSQYNEFNKFLNTETSKTKSSDILEIAKQASYIPFQTLFSEDNELQDIFDYERKLKGDSPSADIGDTMEWTGIDSMDENKQGDGEGTEILNHEANKTIDVSAKDLSKAIKEQALEHKKEKKKPKVEEPESEESYDLIELSKKYQDLSAALFSVVKGQDQAIEKLIKGYNASEMLKKSKQARQPKAHFFFLGPAGTGKTLLAETFAKNLGIPHKTFNMSEYTSGDSHDVLIGTPKMYSNAKEGILVEYVRENPRSLLIFDEIEKASMQVIRLFLQILGSGKLFNIQREEETSFEDTIIIFTSNVGSDLYEDRGINLTALPDRVVLDALKTETDEKGKPILPPEICSRIASGNMILFNHLSVQHLVEMIKNKFDKVVLNMKAEHDVTISYPSELPLLFLYNKGDEIDARIADTQSENFLVDGVYGLIRQLEKKKSVNQIKSIQFEIDWNGMDNELKSLFKNNEKSEVLVLTDKNELFSSIDEEKYKIHIATTVEEAQEYLERDITAVFIDPIFGVDEVMERALSISDFSTQGNEFFNSLVERESGLPIYLLEIEREFSDTDRKTFMQKGAFGTISVKLDQITSFRRQYEQIMEELYMEKESQSFSQRGWILDFKTKQELIHGETKAKIVFYALKKRLAVDMEARGQVLEDIERPDTKFEDVIGAEDAKDELKYYSDYLKNPKKFLMNGGESANGILLYGPPGTGKTMLARAMAGESDVTFLETKASAFKNRYVGESESNIRKLFKTAKKYAPAVVFIDEIDTIGRQRTGGEMNAHTEDMLNALLAEMDGFASKADNTKPVFVIAATNYGIDSNSGIATLDEALVRRFDRHIYVDLPNEEERKEYINRQVKEKEMEAVTEETAQNIAERTTGQSIAILKKVIDLANRTAIKQSREVTDNDLLKALEEYLYGEEHKRTPEYYKQVAIHETGHAYISYINGIEPSYVTIESRGNFGGYTYASEQEDKPQYSKEELLGHMRMLLAGRAAEIVFYGNDGSLNTGARNDLERATDVAWDIICGFGMNEDQLAVLDKIEVLKSPMAEQYVQRVNDMLGEEMNKTLQIISENKDKIEEIANTLAKDNRLTKEQFKSLMEDN